MQFQIKYLIFLCVLKCLNGLVFGISILPAKGNANAVDGTKGHKAADKKGVENGPSPNSISKVEVDINVKRRYEFRNNGVECRALRSMYNKNQGENYCGDVTFYDTGLSACGKVHKNTDFIAAINIEQFGYHPNPNAAPICNRCAIVRGSNNKQVKVRIVDKCMGCKYGDLDLSPSAFSSIYSLGKGRARINWEFVEC
ncbi:hypothetical protein BB560_000499 [Smittium megazygosporum]|uniref:RlpA-like protein double-psi beta-barrel domain-containing protein n=1 Tax=Smittium megazygosporum TaxID=133381 RepID=A0A2T9ZK54_9FUNG|nr:hypothetical protein BB560_000499 [Smittium megazygosporum]